MASHTNHSNGHQADHHKNRLSILSLKESPTSRHLANDWPTETHQVHENDFAEFAIVCSPGLPKLMGSLHPAGSLYEKPVNTSLSLEQHLKFQRLLEESGVRVMDVRDILVMDTATDVGARLELEEFAASCLKYQLDPSCDPKLLRPEDSYYVGEQYKQLVLQAMSAEQLVDIIMTNPTVTIMPSFRDTQFTADFSFKPLSNIVFTRDQQITTCKGIVMARLSSIQRQNEVNLMQFCFRKLGLKVVGSVQDPGRLEGGDFFPAGDDLCFIGIGLRSNMEAVQQLLDNDWFGTQRVAVVKDEFERHQDRMHLDCVFNIIGSDVCLMLKEMIGDDSPTRRTVNEYTRTEENGKVVYKLTRSGVEFSRYVTENNYNIIPVSSSQQLAYGCNCLNLGGGNIIAVHSDTARQIACSPNFKGHIRYHDFSAITSMYGAVHCASQIVKRSKAPFLKPSRKRPHEQ